MASIKDLKKRITSVKNTQQTTKAMKMVSAAKLRRAQEAIMSNRPYSKAVGALMEELVSLPEVTVNSPLFTKENEENQGKKKLLLLIVTSDRGLCAGFNSNIIRTAGRFLTENASNYASISFGYLGKRGYDFYKTKKVDQGPYYEECGGKVTFQKAKILTNDLTKRYLDGEFDEVRVLYNVFKNAVSQVVTFEDFLPLKPITPSAEAKAEGKTKVFVVKPNVNTMVEALIEKHFTIQIFRIMLESQAGEYGARMSAMENATKNAGEMIKKLTLQYNKQRQAGITKELLEIIAGSESQKT